jgi:hypothetical protein
MANADVLDILSDSLTPNHRNGTSKEEIIREKVGSSSRHDLIADLFD